MKNNNTSQNLQREESKDYDFTPVGKMCRKIDLPHLVANRFIGKTEKETDEIIEAFMKWYIEHFVTIDIKSKEQWLGIIRNQEPCNTVYKSFAKAVLNFSNQDLRHIARAYPQLVEAIKKYRKNGYK